MTDVLKLSREIKKASGLLKDSVPLPEQGQKCLACGYERDGGNKEMLPHTCVELDRPSPAQPQKCPVCDGSGVSGVMQPCICQYPIAQPDKTQARSNPVMPFSPLDALIDALPDVRKAGRVKPGDNVMTVHQRIADVYLPIVKRIQESVASPLREQIEGVQKENAIFRLLNESLNRMVRDFRAKSLELAAELSALRTVPK